MSRRIILASPARVCLGIEDYEIEGALDSSDELNSAVQMSELDAGAASDLYTADELAHRAEALEDLTAVAEQTTEADASQLALAEIATDLAVHGTDLNTTEHVLPGLESYIGKSIGVEGLKETTKNMLRALVEFLKAAWVKIKAFFGNVEAQIATLKKKLRDAAGRAADSTVTEAKAKVNGLAIGGKAPGSASELSANIKASNDVLGRLLGGYATVVQRQVELVKKISTSDNILMVSSSQDAAMQNFVGCVKSAKEFVNAELLGNVVLTVDEIPTQEEIDKISEQVVKFRFEAVVGTESANAKEFDITVSEKKAVLDQCLKALDLLDDFRRTKLTKFELTLTDRMSEAITKNVANSMDKKWSDDVTADITSTMRAYGQITRATQRLTQEPFVKVMRATIDSVRAHIAALDVAGKGKDVVPA